MVLTLAEANRVVQAAVAKAEEFNIKASVAVCDAGGHLLAFNRMDGAHFAGAYGSQGKAATAAAFARPSGAVQADSPFIQRIVAQAGGQVNPGGEGAVPIIRNGVIEGACGVGGGSGSQDVDCAVAGVAAVS